MEVERQHQRLPATTFDEASMERSKGFVTALQELKNLRPQLYTAAEYCEKSYLHSEQKQMVLDNLKDYAVRALVNAVDHLGTVAYKLTDLLDQQALDISTTELKISCLNQQILTCQTYMEKEGLRQQQLLAIIPRHHKHYILPTSNLGSVNKKVHFSPNIETNARQSHQAKPRIFPSGTPASKTLSWHLPLEPKSTLKGTPRAVTNEEEAKTSSKSSTNFRFSDTEVVGPASSVAIQTLAVTRRDFKPLTAFKSFDNRTRHDMVQVPVRSKSVLAAFFVKKKTSKLKTSEVS